MDGKGNDALLKTTKVTEWNVNNGGYIGVAFGGLILLGCAVAYIIAVARGNVDAILPLISDAAGSPPQNGLFGTLISLGGMCGVIFMIQRYMIVLEKNREKSNMVTTVNKLSLFVGIVSMLGITLITGFPVNFYRNRDVWLMDVGLPHMIGGVMLFALGLVYIALQCILTLFLKTRPDRALPVRVLLLFICTAAFVYHMITVPENFGGISHLYYINNTEFEGVNYTGILPYPPTLGASLKLPIDTGGSYIPSAIAEWIFVFFFCCFFFTFFYETQEYSMLIVIETHAPHESDVADKSKLDFEKGSLPHNGNQIDTKPVPEVRKLFRRDSTSQTMTDGLENTTKQILESTRKEEELTGDKSAPMKSTKIDVANGTKTGLSNAEVEATLSRILGENHSAVGINGNLKTTSTSMEDEVSTGTDNLSTANGHMKSEKDADKEEERIAVERIDNAVKDAENAVNNSTKSVQENNATSKKIDREETSASNCPLSVQ